MAHPGQVEAGPRRTGGRHRLPTQTETALAAVHQSMEIDHLSDGEKNILKKKDQIQNFMHYQVF